MGYGGREGREGLAAVHVDALALSPVRQVRPAYLTRQPGGGGGGGRSLSAMEFREGGEEAWEHRTMVQYAGPSAVASGREQERREAWREQDLRRRSTDEGAGLLRAGEKAHLDRVSRLDAKLGWSKGATGEWQRREVKRPRTARREGESAGFSLERLAVYDQELVDNKAVRKRYNLDAASSKNQTLRLKLSTRLGAEAADGRVELPHIP